MKTLNQSLHPPHQEIDQIRHEEKMQAVNLLGATALAATVVGPGYTYWAASYGEKVAGILTPTQGAIATGILTGVGIYNTVKVSIRNERIKKLKANS